MPKIEEDIVARINEGDTKAFEQLYSSCYTYLCAVATKYIFNAEAARAVVNDIFLSVWNNRSTLVSPLLPYLIRSVRNRCVNYLRQQRLQMVPFSEVQDGLLAIQEELAATGTHPLAYLENKEMEEKIYEAINQLPPRCRTIFIEYLYHNKTYEEIAQANNITSSTVRGQIKIGLSKLKDLLGDIYPLFLFLFDFSEK